MKKMKCQFGIKYKVTHPRENIYLFSPVALVKGEETQDGFQCDNGNIYPIFYDTIGDLRKPYVDLIYADDELAEIEEYDGDDVDFIGEYFFDHYKDVYMVVDITDVNEAGIPYRNMINIQAVKEEDDSIIYYMDDAVPNLVLNGKAVRELLDADSIDKMKLIIMKYQMGLNSIKKYRETDGITRISITGNKINYYETNRAVDIKELDDAMEKGKANSNSINNTIREISYQGLRNYLKERIYGHDEEIDTFAQKLYMNHTAAKGETVESILFVGPTGTGKTETVKAACEYLGIPMFETNASNIVPQGIKGTSIEDIIIGLYENASCDIEKAQKGLVFLDEFDKLNDSDLDIKVAVKNILLTFTAGGNFPIDTDHYHFMFDSSMTNKIYAGVFERININKNPIGFSTTAKFIPNLGTAEEIRKKIVDKKYFSQEELTRISTILAYNDLSRETKKDILLNNKYSEYAKKRDRYLRQFGIDLILNEEYVDTVLDKLAGTTGMRSVNNLVKRTINNAERVILENEDKGYKRLVLTKETVNDPNKFDLSK